MTETVPSKHCRFSACRCAVITEDGDGDGDGDGEVESSTKAVSTSERIISSSSREITLNPLKVQKSRPLHYRQRGSETSGERDGDGDGD